MPMLPWCWKVKWLWLRWVRLWLRMGMERLTLCLWVMWVMWDVRLWLKCQGPGWHWVAEYLHVALPSCLAVLSAFSELLLLCFVLV